ncbi:hypothetical protein E0I26_01150 [Flavobacterium rhamnosiphilum]|uniref:DUF4595 domain-containing protein n=1 Tax=Flavobacterium rhamnosiphilum TaxID=2541724 RepID=A0A4R5FCP6_9FLAO|nr:hypothetical protein [Flavobacterium rhamnosiphilum]TDE46720.1 hypothetical protein E0I26_01150 [Flavobacterium rhamnosiphilum]
MKNLIFVLSFAFLFSCSKPEDNQPSNSNVKLLKSVTETGETYGGFSSYHYENNILTKVNYGELNNYMAIQQLGYENKKLIKIAHDDDYAKGDVVNPEDFSYNYNLNSYPVETISYMTNSIFYKSIYRDYIYNLNSQKQITSIIENNSLSNEFVYNNTQLTKQKHPGSNPYEYTFTFDDKINPFNVLYTKFGLLDDYICPLLGRNYLYHFLSPNNIKEVYKNGVLIYSFIYQYNDENQPISVVAYDYSNSKTHQYAYTYTN